MIISSSEEEGKRLLNDDDNVDEQGMSQEKEGFKSQAEADMKFKRKNNKKKQRASCSSSGTTKETRSMEKTKKMMIMREDMACKCKKERWEREHVRLKMLFEMRGSSPEGTRRKDNSNQDSSKRW